MFPNDVYSVLPSDVEWTLNADDFSIFHLQGWTSAAAGLDWVERGRKLTAYWPNERKIVAVLFCGRRAPPWSLAVGSTLWKTSNLGDLYRRSPQVGFTNPVSSNQLFRLSLQYSLPLTIYGADCTFLHQLHDATMLLNKNYGPIIYVDVTSAHSHLLVPILRTVQNASGCQNIPPLNLHGINLLLEAYCRKHRLSDASNHLVVRKIFLLASKLFAYTKTNIKITHVQPPVVISNNKNSHPAFPLQLIILKPFPYSQYSTNATF